MPPVKKVNRSNKTKTKPTKEPTGDSVISGQLNKKIKKQQQIAANKRGVIFIKHLPHGFFENQLKKYFEQFGDVTRLRLARSKRTGGSKGYAFVEFEYPEVAQVAAETMNNYLMFKKVVKAEYIPPEQQKFNYFKSSLRKVKDKAGKEIYVSSKTHAVQRKVNEYNDWSEEAYHKRTVAKLNQIKKLNEKYVHLGIDFSSVVVQPKKITIDKSAPKIPADETSASNVKNSKTSKAKNKRTLTEVVASAQKKIKKSDINLEDLLGNTINDDSDDEDYIALEPEADEEINDDEATSDEEAYGFSEDSDDDDDDDDEEEDKEEVEHKFSNKSKTSNGKPVKVDCFDKLIKRKPHVGGIQKLNKKKPQEKPTRSKAKTIQQLSAAKEIAKPLVARVQNKSIKTKGKRKV